MITDVLTGTARWTVEQGEALALLRSMPDACVDAVVTDPPYAATSEGSSYVIKRSDANGNGRMRPPTENQFFEAWIREHLAEWRRILKPTGAVWLTIDWRGALALDEAAAKLGLRAPSVGVWDRGGLGMGFVLRHVYECFAVLPMHGFVRRLTDEPDLWRVEWTPGNRETGHAAEKPIALFRRALRLVCAPEALILDPFAGSSTTLIAALVEGMRCIGIERDSDSCEIGRNRCRNVEAGNAPAPVVSAQMSLLGGEG